MRDRDGFPNRYDFERDADIDREDFRDDRDDFRHDYERDRELHFGRAGNERPRQRGGRWGFGSDIRGVGSAAGYSGFGGPGWTAGGFGDPGYNTSGFGTGGSYGTSRYGSGNYEGGTTRNTSGNSAGPYSSNRFAGDAQTTGRVERGAHWGKGPKNYTRSDDRIREDICETLTEHHEIDASDIEISVASGAVTLSGTVNDRRSKWLAEEIIESISGVKDVRNELRTTRTTIATDDRR